MFCLERGRVIRGFYKMRSTHASRERAYRTGICIHPGGTQRPVGGNANARGKQGFWNCWQEEENRQMKVGRAQPSPVQFRKRLPAEKNTSG